jgi:hypothetical protein
LRGVQFSVDTDADEGFYVTVAESVTVYESYGDAIAEIQDKISADTESFVAEVAIESNSEEDVAITLEQISWQEIIQDMAEVGEGLDA